MDGSSTIEVTISPEDDPFTASLASVSQVEVDRRPSMRLVSQLSTRDINYLRRASSSPITFSVGNHVPLVRPTSTAQASDVLRQDFLEQAIQKDDKGSIHVEDFADLLQKPVDLSKWVPNTASDGCQRCKKVFGILRRRHHCRYCGFLVCNQCSQARVVFQEEQSVPVRVCTRCMLKIVGRIDALYNRRYMRAAINGHTSPASLTPPGISSPRSENGLITLDEHDLASSSSSQTNALHSLKASDFKLDDGTLLKKSQSFSPECPVENNEKSAASSASTSLPSSSLITQLVKSRSGSVNDDINEVVRRLTTVQSVDEKEWEEKEGGLGSALKNKAAEEEEGDEELDGNESIVSTESTASYIAGGKAQKWTCVMCSFSNTGILDSCEMCGTLSKRSSQQNPCEKSSDLPSQPFPSPLKSQRSVKL